MSRRFLDNFSGLQRILSKGGEYIGRLKNVYNTGKEIFDNGKKYYDIGKNIYENVGRFGNLFKGHEVRNILPHSREHYDRLNQQGIDYAKQKHNEFHRRSVPLDENEEAKRIVENVRLS